MDGFQVICTIFVTVVAYADSSAADHEYMLTKPESLTVSINFETKLECVMNILPDKFQWKFYPLDKKDSFNPKAPLSLTNSKFRIIPADKYEPQKKMSSLTLQADSTEIAGDYQCLAHYGASVVASIPWRITIANLTHFRTQEKVDATVVVGNTISWRCEPPPMSNPEPYVDYVKNGQYFPRVISTSTKSLIIPNATTSDSGHYACKSGNTEGDITSGTLLNLRVVRHVSPEPPRFLIRPKTMYEVNKGDSVFLECAAVGNPVPKVEWRKKVGIFPEHRCEKLEGGLVIKNVSSSDNGVYECVQKNHLGTISHYITLNYNEPPKIDCLLTTTDVTQGDNLDLDCSVTGTPTPEVSWFLNGFVVNDSKIETDGNKIYFMPVEKRHAGNLQIFARNVLGTVYRTISIKVIPLSTTQEVSTDKPAPPTRGNHRNNNNNSRKPPKHGKMVPPSRPNISRLNDEAVLLRWTVQMKGLPIQFFKVQYRELGPDSQRDHHNRKGSKWMTTNTDIPPHMRSYEVTNLKPDHWYRFRIAAVYSNNDNKNSPTSEKFHLRKLDFDKRNPLPIPLVTKTETINSTSVKIYWKYNSLPNITVDGFFVNYNSASSAADYMREVVDGQHTNSYILTHLQPDTVYDIKLQSFTSKSASDFSAIMKAKTLGVVSTTSPPMKETVTPSLSTEPSGISKLYIIIAVSVVGGCGLIFALIGVLLFCKRSKQKKNSNRGDRDKGGVDDHRIQADAEYVVGSKNAPRSNGCVPPNRITITANPLADADNKVRYILLFFHFHNHCYSVCLTILK
jgi:hypothetical protein